MKKWLILFVMVDFVFVGLVLRLSTQNERNIANVSGSAANSEMTEGQQQKYDLVQSMHFTAGADQLVLQTAKLQMICDTSSLIELNYVAMNVAYAGAQPTIAHVFSCAEIKKDLSVDKLETNLSDFKSMKQNKKLALATSQLSASQVYSDEEFPTEWKLAEISITGASTFTINQYEIEKVQSAGAFDFTLTSVK